MDQILAILTPLLQSLAGHYGWLVQVVAMMGTLRLVFKPIMTALEALAAATPTKADDAVVAEVEGSKVYKWFTFALDYLASVKVK